MKKTSKILSILMLVVMLIIAGCGSGSSDSGSGSGSSGSSSSGSSASSGSSSGSGSTGSSGGQAAPAQDPVKLIMIGTLPVNSYGTVALDDFKKKVEERTNGTVLIETFPAGQLYNDQDAVNVIPTGSADMGIVQLDFWTGKVPEIGALYIPMMFNDHEHYYRSRDAMMEILDEKLQQNGNVKIIGWFNYNDQTIISKKPIAKIEDFKGKRMRGWGQYSAAFFEYAGATPIAMAAGEVYDALAKGVIDGAMSTPASHVSRKFYEVAKNVTDMVLEPVTPYAILINVDSWNKLTDEQKQILTETAKEVDEWSKVELHKETEAAMKQLADLGVNIVKIEGEEYNRIRETVLPKLSELLISQTGETGQQLLDIIEEQRNK